MITFLLFFLKVTWFFPYNLRNNSLLDSVRRNSKLSIFEGTGSFVKKLLSFASNHVFRDDFFILSKVLSIESSTRRITIDRRGKTRSFRRVFHDEEREEGDS